LRVAPVEKCPILEGGRRLLAQRAVVGERSRDAAGASAGPCLDVALTSKRLDRRVVRRSEALEPAAARDWSGDFGGFGADAGVEVLVFEAVPVASGEANYSEADSEKGAHPMACCRSQPGHGLTV
jgi:hypothetical protein